MSPPRKLPMSDLVRLDAALVIRGIVGGRDKAKVLIEQGHVFVNGAVVTKAATRVTESDIVTCDVRERFVGRGGEKLLKVLEQTNLSVEGKVCADIGASTGGFTDCMLQHGAKAVFAVDVGHDQLADVLRADARVTCMEGVDIRCREKVTAFIADGSVDLITMDVSFISLTAVWDAVMPLLKSDGMIVCLIKPQFEAGRAALSKRGVVKSAKDHVRVLQTLFCFWQEQGLSCSYASFSPIKGGEGNIEYVAVLSRGTGVPPDASAIVFEAFETLS